MLKYIYIREHDGREFPVFCTGLTSHLALANAMQAYVHGRMIVSAGFVEWVDGEARTYGRSESLNVGPRTTDAVYLTTLARATATVAAASMNQAATPLSQ